jgi:glycosyltransferase involved in cell wall biosynthesis
MAETKKILVLSSHTKSLFWFRMDMMRSFLRHGYAVVAVGSEPKDEWQDKFQKENIRYQSIPISRNGLNPFGDLKTYHAIKKLLEVERPDKIFCYQAKTVIYGTIAAHHVGITDVYPLIAGLGSIFRGQGVKNVIIRQIMKREYQYALRFAKKIIFQNRDDLECFVQERIVKRECTEIINGSGVDTRYFTPTPFPEQMTFLMISRLIRDKGVFEYLEAARAVRQKNKDVRFLLVGPYDTNPSALKPEELQGYISDGSIEYLGELTDVRPAIAQSSVYVLPSYHEGTPKTVLEAMACGRPIITTDAPGCRETVKDGVNGYLVELKNVQALIEIIMKVIDNREGLEKKGNESRKIAVEKYDVNIVNKQIEMVIGLNK